MQATTKTNDKRRMRGEESRRLILQSAIDSIAAMGLGSMTLDKVAERAGISRGLVLFHFKSKGKLLEEVLNYLGKQYENGWNAVYEEPTAAPIKKVLALVDYDIRFAYENPRFVSAWHAFWGEAKGNMLYLNLSFPRDVSYEDQLRELLVSAMEDEGADPAEATSITMGLTAMMFGIWIESHLNPDEDDCINYLKTVRVFLGKVFPNQAMD